MSRTAVTAALALALATMLAPAASADDGTEVGGQVPSVVALSLSAGGELGRLPAATRPRAFDAPLAATVTATDAPTQLTVADGDVAAGRAHGRLATGGGLLADPLLVAGPGSAWRSLAGAGDAQVARWTRPLAAQPVTVRLRQPVPARAARTVRPKIVLVTLSVEGP